MQIVRGIENLHTLAMHGGHPLGVECKGCRHRALVSVERLRAFKGNMKQINRLKLVCSMCGCRYFEATLFNSAEEAAQWMPEQPRDPLF